MRKFVATIWVFTICLAATLAANETDEITDENLIFPKICPNEDADWCEASTSAKESKCNYQRADSSIVYRLLDNIWYNCPKYCFDCIFPGKELNITVAELIEGQQLAKLPPLENPPSADVLEFLLEYRTIEEAFKGPCEDAAVFGESGEPEVCAIWAKEQGESFCEKPNVKMLSNTNPKEDFSAIKGNGYWWCKKSCGHC